MSAITQVSNEAKKTIDLQQPYVGIAEIEGTAPFLFHRWSVDGVAAKSNAAKGSKAKKEDDLESYVYRDRAGVLCIPGEYFRMAVIAAAKFRQDPRSPRKSAMDLFKAGVVAIEELCTIGSKEWDFIDRRRVMVQRNGVTRCRPALASGWKVQVPLMVSLPEYIPPSLLNEVIQSAGRLIGVGDFRPTFGRFIVTGFVIVQD